MSWITALPLIGPLITALAKFKVRIRQRVKDGKTEIEQDIDIGAD